MAKNEVLLERVEDAIAIVRSYIANNGPMAAEFIIAMNRERMANCIVELGGIVGHFVIVTSTALEIPPEELLENVHQGLIKFVEELDK